VKLGFYISLIIDDKTFYETIHEIKNKKIYNSIEFFYPEDKKIRIKHLKRFIYAKENLSYIYDYSMHLPFQKVNIGSKNSNLRRYSINLIKEAIKYASKVNVKTLTLHMGLIEKSNKESLKLNILAIKEILKEVKKYNMILCIENLCIDNSLTKKGKDLLNIIDIINDDNLKVTLDIGHIALTSKDIISEIELLKKYINHIHIHNNDLKNDLHLNLNNGLIDIPSIIKKLKEINYKNTILVETGYIKEDYIDNYNYLISII
jgi:sugar phosphate isomerase/epimerase